MSRKDKTIVTEYRSKVGREQRRREEWTRRDTMREFGGSLERSVVLFT